MRSVRCPACGSFDDKVVDSRQTDDGTSIRRRRACIDCGRRFTTFERLEEAPLIVVKRSGDRQPFDREKVAIGIRLAAKGRPIEADGGGALDELINAVEDAMRLDSYYVENWSMTADLVILWKTVRAVVASEGAY